MDDAGLGACMENIEMNESVVAHSVAAASPAVQLVRLTSGA